jgi:hypothetical protein
VAVVMGRKKNPAYPGTLNEPIVRREYMGLLAKFDSDEQRIIRARMSKIELLFEHYQIPFGEPQCWEYLALRLALAHVPGFAVVNTPLRKRGRPKKWEISAARELVQTVDAIATERKRGINDAIQSAVKRLPQKWPTKEGKRRSSEKEFAALETRYYESKARLQNFDQAMKGPLTGLFGLGASVLADHTTKK